MHRYRPRAPRHVCAAATVQFLARIAGLLSALGPGHERASERERVTAVQCNGSHGTAKNLTIKSEAVNTVLSRRWQCWHFARQWQKGLFEMTATTRRELRFGFGTPQTHQTPLTF